MRPLKEKRLSPQSPQQNHTLNVEDDIAILSKMPNPSESKYQLLQYQCRESKKEREKEGKKERKKGSGCQFQILLNELKKIFIGLMKMI